MDHIVLRVRDVEESLRFYSEVLGLAVERVEQWRAGEVRFPSVRLNADTIIDLFASDQEPIGKDGAKNQGPLLHGHRTHGHGSLEEPSLSPWAWKSRPGRASGGVPTATASPCTSTTRMTTWWNCGITRPQAVLALRPGAAVGSARPPAFPPPRAGYSPPAPLPNAPAADSPPATRSTSGGPAWPCCTADRAGSGCRSGHVPPSDLGIRWSTSSTRGSKP